MTMPLIESTHIIMVIPNLDRFGAHDRWHIFRFCTIEFWYLLKVGPNIDHDVEPLLQFKRPFSRDLLRVLVQFKKTPARS